MIKKPARQSGQNPLGVFVKEFFAQIVAEFADAWNTFGPPEHFAAKNAVLDEHCATVGRDPREVRRAVNVGLAFTDESLVQQFGNIAEMVRGGVLNGSDEQMIDRIGQYVEAGADQVNIALRAPFDLESVERFAALLKLGGS